MKGNTHGRLLRAVEQALYLLPVDGLTTEERMLWERIRVAVIPSEPAAIAAAVHSLAADEAEFVAAAIADLEARVLDDLL